MSLPLAHYIDQVCTKSADDVEVVVASHTFVPSSIICALSLVDKTIFFAQATPVSQLAKHVSSRPPSQCPWSWVTAQLLGPRMFYNSMHMYARGRQQNSGGSMDENG